MDSCSAAASDCFDIGNKMMDFARFCNDFRALVRQRPAGLTASGLSTACVWYISGLTGQLGDPLPSPRQPMGWGGGTTGAERPQANTWGGAVRSWRAEPP